MTAWLNQFHEMAVDIEYVSKRLILLPCSHAVSGLSPHGKENGENGTPLMSSHRSASVEAILRMVQVRPFTLQS